MGATTTQVATSRRTVSEVTLDLGPLADGEASTTVRSDVASVSTTFRWPGAEVLAGWDLLAAGGAPAADGFELGTTLFRAAFADPRALRAFHDAAAGGAFVRLRIRTGDPDLASLPWELLADPTRGEFLGRSGSIVRWFDPPDAVPVPAGRTLAADRPIRALVVGVSPDSSPLPNLGVELAAIRRAYEDAVADDVAVEPTVLEGATRRAFADALREATESGRPYDVVHLSCHAGVPPGHDQPVLVLSPDDGDNGLVSPDALARLVADAPPRLVVLNACASLSADGLGARVVQPGFATPATDTEPSDDPGDDPGDDPTTTTEDDSDVDTDVTLDPVEVSWSVADDARGDYTFVARQGGLEASTWEASGRDGGASRPQS